MEENIGESSKNNVEHNLAINKLEKNQEENETKMKKNEEETEQMIEKEKEVDLHKMKENIEVQNNEDETIIKDRIENIDSEPSKKITESLKPKES